MAARTTTTPGMTPRVARLSPPQTRPRRPRLRRVLRWTLWLAVPVVAVGIGGVVGVLYTFANVPLPEKAPTAQAIVFMDRYGHQLTTLAPEENRSEVPVETISPNMKAAVLAAEDRGFYHHGAISYRGLARAAFANVVQRRVAQGGSTITQQYVKNAIPDVGRERTLFRKLKEAIMAVKLEQKYSKDQILGFYLNTIYFGRGAYGVEAAARTYFPKVGHRPETNSRNLTPAQAAFLAGAIRSPEFYSRPENAQSARARRNIVLQNMALQGALTQEQAAKAMAVPLGVSDNRSSPTVSGIARSPAPYFFEKVRQQLVDRLGEQRANLGGFKVITTLDPSMQRAATTAVRQVLTRPGDPEASLVAIDPRSGAVRAMYGGRNYQKQQFNLATDAMRQAGSTMKPFVLEQWLKDGNSVRATFPGPPKIVVDGQQIHNYGGESYGTVDLLKATRDSINTVYMQLIEKAQAPRVAEIAGATGVSDVLSSLEHRPDVTQNPSRAHPSLALGANGVSALQLASAYGTWANRGLHAQPYLIEGIEDLAGRRIQLIDVHGRKFPQRAPPRRVVSAEIADTINGALQGVVERGTGTAAQIGRPAAGKTGTTNDYTDARFVGYTPDLVASVWMGYQDERHKLLNVHGIPQVSGGSLPALMWRDFMSRALSGGPPTPFAQPDPASAGQAQTAAPSTTAAPPKSTAPPTTVPRTTHPPSTTTPPSSTTGITLPSSTVPPKSTRPPGAESEPPTEPPPGGG
jgi:penicillin-binding protein 1A